MGNSEFLDQFARVVCPGESAVECDLRTNVLRIARSGGLIKRILLLGPQGVGKSYLARIIAACREFAFASDDRKQALYRAANKGRLDRELPAFVEVNAATLTSTLATSQLFGIVRAATDVPPRPGVFELAMYAGDVSFGKPTSRDGNFPVNTGDEHWTGGTVLLDELPEAPAEVQAQLLTFLNEGRFWRLGQEGVKGEEVEYRGLIIASSWRSLPVLLSPEGGAGWRADLVSRFHSFITVPELNQRRESIWPLACIIANRINDSLRKDIERETHARRELADTLRRMTVKTTEEPNGAVDLSIFRDGLAGADWKHGNVRLLEGTILRIALERGAITVEEAQRAVLKPGDGPRNRVEQLLQLAADTRASEWNDADTPEAVPEANSVANLLKAETGIYADMLLQALSRVPQDNLARFLGAEKRRVQKELSDLRTRMRNRKSEAEDDSGA